MQRHKEHKRTGELIDIEGRKPLYIFIFGRYYIILFKYFYAFIRNFYINRGRRQVSDTDKAAAAA